MSYCRIHGEYSGDGCSDCRSDEERASSDRQEMLEQLNELRQAQRDAPDKEELAHAINNPGDYACPHCKLRTLLFDASRCPRCQKDIENDYWVEVCRRGREDRLLAEERAKEEQKRNEENRPEEERRSAEERQRNEEEQRRSEEEQRRGEIEAKRIGNRRAFAWFYFLYLLPVLFWVSAFIILKHWALDNLLVFVPVINWLATVPLLAQNGPLPLLGFGFWATVGVVFLLLPSGKKK